MKHIEFQEMDCTRTSFGRAMYVRVRTPDYQQLTWEEIQEAYSGLYPYNWAIQFFPPADEVVNEENIYHLYVLEDRPVSVTIDPIKREEDDWFCLMDTF